MNNLPMPGQANVACVGCDVDKYQTSSGVWWYQLCSSCPAGYRSPPKATSCSLCSDIPCMTVCNCPEGTRWGGMKCIPVKKCPRRICIAGRYVPLILSHVYNVPLLTGIRLISFHADPAAQAFTSRKQGSDHVLTALLESLARTAA
jgi:hypothetical protein